MVIDVHDIRRNIRREFLSTEKHVQSAGTGKWRLTFFIREDMVVFFRRFGLTFRETFTEWRRWGWPTSSSMPSSASLQSREEEIPTPQIGISRQPGSVVVRAELPGLRGEDVRIEFFDGVLMLSGEYRIVGKGETGSVQTFFRTLTLPEGITGRDATIEFGEGKLEISMTLPLQEDPLPNRDMA